jgi:hypothetical protein
MKGLLYLAVIGAGLYYAYMHFGSPAASQPPASSADTTPGANAANRIDNLSGAAPSP